MSDLISRSALKEEMVKDLAASIYMSEMRKTDIAIRVLNRIDEAPAVDAVPVVHGRNIRTAGRKYRDFHCSVCGAGACNVEGGTLDGGFFNYCPNCGAKMDAEDDEHAAD